MNKDLKDLIDSIDTSNKTHSDLETMIKYLKEEVQRLNFTINEQKQIIQDLNLKLSKIDNTNIPEDMALLKELVHTQRQEIVKKDKDIEILQRTIEEVSLELNKMEDYEGENEELIYAQKIIVQLTDENQILKDKNELLNSEMKELHNQINLKKQEIFDENQELIDANKLIFQLKEETDVNKVRIESLMKENEVLKADLNETTSIQKDLSKGLEESEKLIDQLTFDNDQMQEKINFFQQKLEITGKEQKYEDNVSTITQQGETYQKQLQKYEEEILELKNIINSNISIMENLQQKNFGIQSKLDQETVTREQKSNEFTKLIAEKERELEHVNLKLHKIQNSNKKLSDLIVELKLKEIRTPEEPKLKVTSKNGYNNKIPNSIFFKMYNKLDEEAKNYIVDQLINDLQSSERDLKINAIKVLSFIKSKKVFDALINLKNDNDWIVKLYLIKVLNLFKDLSIENTLKFLQKDIDNDVREAATELLLKLNLK